MKNVAICGATGYTGLELIRILLKHPRVMIKALTAKMDGPAGISGIFPELKGRLSMACEDLDAGKLLRKKIDLVFLALPHKVSMEYVPGFLENGKVVIDLSADFRLKNAAAYERYYRQRHTYSKYLRASVYGLPELHRPKIKKAKLIANPGCYPTTAILAAAPLLSRHMADTGRIIVDAKSGTTGAGRRGALYLNFSEVNENIMAYKIGVHQHTPEIEQELSFLAKKNVHILFTPHLIPMNRGILTTSYIGLNKKAGVDKLLGIYESFYRNEPFVRICAEGVLPQVKDVINSNYCDIGIALSPDNKTAVVVSAIDNLRKGASGQAVQNMNIAFGFPERTGLV